MPIRSFVLMGGRTPGFHRAFAKTAKGVGSALLILAGAGCVSLDSNVDGSPVKVEGGLLVSAEGMTLYVFDRDQAAGPGKSVCVARCAANWPPFLAGGDASPSGDYGIIPREGGVRQWTYRGRPLYTWIKDIKPGEATGDGLNKVWHVARP